jgi:hypothetical protein
VVEVWLDSLDSKSKIAECKITNTGGSELYQAFTAKLLMPVSGNHDVYLRFRGTGSDKLFTIQWLTFVDATHSERLVSIPDNRSTPDAFVLNQNYPNPFNPTTAISYQLSAISSITLKVYDLLGREIVTLVHAEQVPGPYTVNWDGKDEHGEQVTSGMYLYRLRAGTTESTRKMILVK